MSDLPKKENRGGMRPGFVKPKGEPTATVTFRVPAHMKEEFKEKVREVIRSLKYP